MRLARLFIRLGMIRTVDVEDVEREDEHFVVDGERAVQDVFVVAVVEA